MYTDRQLDAIEQVALAASIAEPGISKYEPSVAFKAIPAMTAVARPDGTPLALTGPIDDEQSHRDAVFFSGARQTVLRLLAELRIHRAPRGT